MAISSSYMVTNRAWPTWRLGIYIYPVQPPGANFYFLAPGPNNPDLAAYNQIGSSTSTMPPSFQSQLEADIESAVQSGGPEVTVYIHGLAYVLSDACNTLGTFGQNLAAQGYKGLLLGFSWPSYGDTDSILYYSSTPYSFPPAGPPYGTIRENINGSTASLLNLLNQLVPLCKKHKARLNLVSHSEGNYMLMLAMYALASNPGAWPALAGPFLDQVLMLAADINNGALQALQGPPPGAGQGSWIAQSSNTVTVYWSSNDDRLPWSEDHWTKYHNGSFPHRLGLYGLNSNASGVILPNVYGLDCSLVVKFGNKHIPLGKSVHESYFYIPQVLLDMTQTLGDVPPAQVVNRVSTRNQSFQMTRMPEPLQSPFQPRDTRLPKAVPANT